MKKETRRKAPYPSKYGIVSEATTSAPITLDNETDEFEEGEENFGSIEEFLVFDYYMIITQACQYVGWVTKNYNEVSHNNKNIIANLLLLDKDSLETILLDNHGEMGDTRPSSMNEINVGIPGLPTNEFYGQPIAYPVKKEKKKVEKKDITDRKLINSTSLLSITRGPASFWKTVNLKELPDDEVLMDKLVRIAVTEPAQFDELFTVEIDRPESPLMRRYLITLSDLINESLNGLDDGIDDIKPLEQEAYKKAGYVGKTFETVVEEAKDYAAHLRFLLLKNERIVVREDEKNYFDSLVKLIKNEELTKNKNEHQFIEPIPGSIFGAKTTIPHVRKAGMLELTYFLFVDNLYSFNDSTINPALAIKIALNDMLFRDENKFLVSKGNELHNCIFVSDRDFNIARFLVKKQTLNKWAKLLSELLDEASKIPTNADFSKYSTKIVDFII